MFSVHIYDKSMMTCGLNDSVQAARLLFTFQIIIIAPTSEARRHKTLPKLRADVNRSWFQSGRSATRIFLLGESFFGSAFRMLDFEHNYSTMRLAERGTRARREHGVTRRAATFSCPRGCVVPETKGENRRLRVFLKVSR